MKYRICLTGGIASGKTYVSDRLAEMGFFVIDADVLAREVVKKGTSGLEQLVKAFGDDVLDDKGLLNRVKLKSIVFKDESKLKHLNAILHPLIWKSFQSYSQSNQSETEVWVIPLYNGGLDFVEFNRVLVLDVSQKIQLARMQDRDDIDYQGALSILKAQPSRKERLKLATDVISNNKGFDLLNQNVNRIFKLIKTLEIHQIKSCS